MDGVSPTEPLMTELGALRLSIQLPSSAAAATLAQSSSDGDLLRRKAVANAPETDRFNLRRLLYFWGICPPSSVRLLPPVSFRFRYFRPPLETEEERDPGLLLSVIESLNI